MNMVSRIRYVSKLLWRIPKSNLTTTQCIRGLSNDLSSRSRTLVGAFPLVRLVFVVVYRITRPFANKLIRKAQENTIFSDNNSTKDNVHKASNIEDEKEESDDEDAKLSRSKNRLSKTKTNRLKVE